MSQLFPTRRESNVSLPDVGTRRTSYPSPILPSPSDYSYDIPKAPAAPSFAPEASYDAAGDLVSPISPSVSFKGVRSRSLLDRVGSVSNRMSKSAKYGRLEDEDADRGARKGSKSVLKEVQEEDDNEHIGFDVSGFDGPFPLRDLPPVASKSTAGPTQRSGNDVEAGYAAEYERLEEQSKSESQYGLGSGMRSVVHAPFLGPKHKRDPSVPAADQNDAQKEADKKGEIVAVTEFPTMDLSLAEGTEWEANDGLRHGQEGNAYTSYYLPEDKNKASWAPFSMKWPYLTLLITIALLLAVLQEVLCQIGLRREMGILHFRNAQDITVLDYFAWKYAPTMILVTYGVMWQITDFEVKRLEPFFQLSQKNGATAAGSLNIDYLTFFSYLTPLKAIRYRQWAVVFSSISTILAGSLAPVLQSASVVLLPDRHQPRGPKVDKIVRMNPIWSRVLSATLLTVAICGTCLLFQLKRRKSGLLSDPKGIAGIASMATTSHILQDFHGLDRVDEATIHKQLKHRRYILHKSSIWQGEYISHVHKQYEQKISRKPQLTMLTLTAGIPYIIFIISIAALIPVLLFVEGASIVTEKIPFLLTALATVIKFIWNTLDSDVRLIEPYFILSRRRAPARTLTLDYTGTPPGWIIIRAVFNRHFLVAIVGVGSVMVELLTVCVSSFSVDGKQFLLDMAAKINDIKKDGDELSGTDETFTSFWVSFVLSGLILFSLVAIAIVVYVKRRHKFCPRPPGTIASVLGYIHKSNMLTTFVDTQHMNSQEMTKYLENQGHTYGLGWFRSKLDHQDHCGVDQEPLLANYVYGQDWDKGRMNGPWHDGF